MKYVKQQVQLAAEPEAVWRVVGDTGNVASWVPAIESSSMQGAIRHATFAGGGGDAREEIVSRDDAARTYTYRYLDGPLALESYESTIRVQPGGAGSTVVWTAQFSAADEGAEAGLLEAIDGIYAAGLAELATQFGG